MKCIFSKLRLRLVFGICNKLFVLILFVGKGTGTIDVFNKPLNTFVVGFATGAGTDKMAVDANGFEEELEKTGI